MLATRHGKIRYNMLPSEENVTIYNTCVCTHRREKIQVEHPKSENVESILLQKKSKFFVKKVHILDFHTMNDQLVKSMQTL